MKSEQEFVVDALQKIRPKSQFIVGETYDSLDWHSTDQTKPTKTEFSKALTSVKNEYSSQEYSRKRILEYPSLEECVHAILDDDLIALQAKRTEVKNKHPKP